MSAANHGHPLEGTLSQCLWLIRVRSILFFDLLVIPPFARFWLWLISIQKDETHQAVHIEPLCCYVRTVESGKKRNGPLVRQVLSVGEKTENIPLASHHYRRHHSHVISPAIVWVCTHTSNVPANSNALSHPFRFCLEMFTILLVRCPRFKGIIKGKIRKKSREL